MKESAARNSVGKRIEKLSQECAEIENQICELEGLNSRQSLSDLEFDLMRELLASFKDGIDEMTVEQKRAAIRTLVRKAVWDGVNVHLVLFGAEGDIEIPVTHRGEDSK